MRETTRIAALGSMVAFALVLSLAGTARAQVLDARRLGMGGAVTSDGGSVRDANIAFRAVPKGKGVRSIPLPIGLIQLASDWPTFDSSDSTFNVWKIVNLAMNPPLTLTINGPEAASGNIAVYVAQDSLQVNLGDVQRVVPREPMVDGGVYHLPGIGKTFGSVFVQVAPLVHVKNTFGLSPDLRAALHDAVPFTNDTRYEIEDAGEAQAAIAFQAGLARRIVYSPGPLESETDDPRRNGATALYLGGAPKVLWGLAYGGADGTGGLTTGDTLFGANTSVALDMISRTRDAAIGTEGGAGFGIGSDVGAVLYVHNVELGVGLNDLGSQIRWKTTVRRHVYVDSTNDFVTTIVARDESFTSRIPVTTTINAATRFGATTVAADLVDNDIATSIHLGAEHWLGSIAVRAGTYRDTNRNWQVTGGAGIRFGGIGLDVALASQSRNIEETRCAELAASISLY